MISRYYFLLFLLVVVSCRLTPKNPLNSDLEFRDEVQEQVRKNGFFLIPGFSGSKEKLLESRGLVGKNFLLDVMRRLDDIPASEIKKEDTQTGPEKSFIESLNQYSFQDIIAKSSQEATSYLKNNRLQVNDSFDKSDANHNSFTSCYSVYEDLKTKKYTEMKRSYLKGERNNRTRKFVFSYCLGEDKHASKDQLIYYFHGVAGSERNWLRLDIFQKVRQHWRARSKLPKWVSISFGPKASLLTNDRDRIFRERVIPWIEKKHGFEKSPPKHRFVLGTSLGGLNALVASLSDPTLFNANFFICPALISLNSFSSKEDFDDYVKRTRAKKLFVNIGFWLRPKHLDHWPTYVEHDPFYVAQKTLTSKHGPMWIQSSSKDQFGFHEGAKIFSILARTRGTKIYHQMLEGGHCAIDAKSVSEFFIQHAK